MLSVYLHCNSVVYMEKSSPAGVDVSMEGHCLRHQTMLKRPCKLDVRARGIKNEQRLVTVYFCVFCTPAVQFGSSHKAEK
jgi:hypothetical protein